MSYSQLELNGKVAVVIGGTSGIGLAIARGMAEAGADDDLVITGTSADPAQFIAVIQLDRDKTGLADVCVVFE